MTFEKGLLPNKNGIKGKGGQILADTILSTWLQKEESGQQNLIALLASVGVTIDNRNESTTSTIDLVTRNQTSANPYRAGRATACDIHSTHNEAETIPDNL